MGKGILSTENKCTKTQGNKRLAFPSGKFWSKGGQLWEEFSPDFSPSSHVRRWVMTGWEIEVEIKVQVNEAQKSR